MELKDWILLIVPIICNGVVVFILQKAFERKQLSFAAKYKYVSILQQKVDNALASFMKVIEATGEDSLQIKSLNEFAKGYCDVYYYYQQNKNLFKPLKKHMDSLISEHKQIEEIQRNLANNKSEDAVICLENHFRTIYEILQSVQNDCIKHKI